MSNLLVLGGTAWLGREIARCAVAQGIDVTCLARGVSGSSAEGVRHVIGDRSGPDAYTQVASTEWDAIVDVSWQPGMVAAAVQALGARAAHWTCVSSCSVYADDGVVGQAEDAPRHPPLGAAVASMADYGPAKARCEDLVLEGLGDRALLARAGLIGGPGDPSDRYGYWVSRLALAEGRPVLVPSPGSALTQVIDVRDLAAWIVGAGERGITGAVNGVGVSIPLDELIAAASRSAGFTGDVVWADPAWLLREGVEPWAGPRSLPLWTGEPEGFWFSDVHAGQSGLVPRDPDVMLADVLSDERARGLERPRRAGLTRPEEEALLALLP